MRLYKRPGSKFWWCTASVRGKAIYFSTRKDDQREARDVATQEVARRLAILPVPALQQGHFILNVAAADLARAQAEGVSYRHQLELEKKWAVLAEFFGTSTPLEDIRYDQIEEYVRQRRLKLRGQTVKREVAALIRGLGIAYRRGWMRQLPPLKPKIRSDAAHLSRSSKAHDPEIVKQVLGRIHPELADACRVVMLTGLRYMELRRLTPGMYEARSDGTGVLTLPAHSTKAKQLRRIGVPKQAAAILARYIMRGGQVIFPRVNYAKALAQACKDIGYDQIVTLRDMRSMYATAALQHTNDFMAVQRSLGHADIKTTERYLHPDPERTLAIARSGFEQALGLEQDMTQGQSSAAEQTAAKMTFSLSKLGERETGFEPATFSLEGRFFHVLPQKTPFVSEGKNAENTRPATADVGHVQVQVTPAIEPRPIVKTYERVKVACEKCTRESETDVKGAMTCVFCDGPVRILV